MKYLILLFSLLSFAHAEEETNLNQLLGLFGKKLDQKGTLILTPTDESSNETVIEYGDADLALANAAFKITVNLKERKKRIVLSYNSKDGYKESWFDGKKEQPFKETRMSAFFSNMFLSKPEAIAELYKIKQRSILDDDSQVMALRYELLPKGPQMPRVTLLLAPKADSIYMLSISHKGQSFIWTNDDYSPR
jgi:hypothetical protein